MRLAKGKTTLALTVLAGLTAGCISGPQRPAATQPSTAIDPATTQPTYWLDQPAKVYVTSNNFQQLWDACEDTARGYFFKLDRIDYRSGVLTTQPLVSGQVFEPWRQDTPTGYDDSESTLATTRRTIRFEFTREGDDSWKVAPKVLVERLSIAEKRITSVTAYRTAFTAPRPGTGTFGSRERDAGQILPERYWYPLRRDPVMERALAEDVHRRVKH